MQRNPPDVKKSIRQKDGFICAHPDCTVPYLEYHHFDPPWEEKQHNNPDGMIALCPTHHGHADGGAFTKEQLRKFKQNAAGKFEQFKVELAWLRQEIAIVGGSNLFYGNKYTIAFDNRPFIWFTNDDEGNKLLNIDVWDENGTTKFQIIDSVLEVKEKPFDIAFAPYGRSIKIEFSEGEFLNIHFHDIDSLDYLKKAYNLQTGPTEHIKDLEKKFAITIPMIESIVKLPLCIIDVKCNLPSMNIKMDTSINENITRNFMGGGEYGYLINRTSSYPRSGPRRIID